MNALWPLLPGWSHEELTRHERRAWSSLPGCSEPPVDPYTEAFLDATLPPPPPQPHRPLPRPADVLQAWRHTTLSGRLSRRRNSCADLLLVSLFDGEIAAVGCGNGSQGLLASKVCYRPRGTQHAPCLCTACELRTYWQGTLAAYHEFKFVLHAAASGALAPLAHRSHTALAPPSHRPRTALAPPSVLPFKPNSTPPSAPPSAPFLPPPSAQPPRLPRIARPTPSFYWTWATVPTSTSTGRAATVVVVAMAVAASAVAAVVAAAVAAVAVAAAAAAAAEATVRMARRLCMTNSRTRPRCACPS